MGDSGEQGHLDSSFVIVYMRAHRRHGVSGVWNLLLSLRYVLYHISGERPSIRWGNSSLGVVSGRGALCQMVSNLRVSSIEWFRGVFFLVMLLCGLWLGYGVVVALTIRGVVVLAVPGVPGE